MSGTQAAVTAKAAPTAISASPALRLQRKCACGGSTELTGECEECQEKKLLGQPLQRKLAVNAPGDEYEREADWVADRVMGMVDSEKETPRARSSTMPLVQRRLGGDGGREAPAIVHDVLCSPGHPLDATTRSFFEPRFGHDFSHVRVHSDANAAQSARDVSAHAYTVGHDLVFASGRYAPRTTEGRRLIAHELAHVTQQSVLARNACRLPLVVQRQPDTPALEAEIGAEPQALEQRLDQAKSAYYDQLWLRFRQATMMCSPEACPELWEHEGDLRREREIRLFEARVILNVMTGDVAAATDDLQKADAGPGWASVEDAAADGLAADEVLDRLARDAADMDVERLFASLGAGVTLAQLAAQLGAVGEGLRGMLGASPATRVPPPATRVALSPPSQMLWGALELSEPELGTDFIQIGTRGPQEGLELFEPGQPEPDLAPNEPDLGSDVVQVGSTQALPEPGQSLTSPMSEKAGKTGYDGLGARSEPFKQAKLQTSDPSEAVPQELNVEFNPLRDQWTTNKPLDVELTVADPPAWKKRFASKSDLEKEIDDMLQRNSAIVPALDRLYDALGDTVQFDSVVEFFAGQNEVKRQDLLQLIIDLNIEVSDLKEIDLSRHVTVEEIGQDFTRGIYNYLAERAIQSKDDLTRVREALGEIHHTQRLAYERVYQKKKPEIVPPAKPTHEESVEIVDLSEFIQQQLDVQANFRAEEQQAYQSQKLLGASEEELRKQINFTGFVSEQLGEIGLQGYILKEYPDAVRMLYSSKGAGVFDGVWYLDNKNDKSITWLIGEAKGAAGEPSVRQIGNKLYEQGTIEHTRDTITSMGSKVKNDPNLEFLVKSLGNALDLNLSSSSSVTFIKVTVPTPVSDVNGNLVLAPLKVEEWKLR